MQWVRRFHGGGFLIHVMDNVMSAKQSQCHITRLSSDDHQNASLSKCVIAVDEVCGLGSGPNTAGPGILPAIAHSKRFQTSGAPENDEPRPSRVADHRLFYRIWA